MLETMPALIALAAGAGAGAVVSLGASASTEDDHAEEMRKLGIIQKQTSWRTAVFVSIATGLLLWGFQYAATRIPDDDAPPPKQTASFQQLRKEGVRHIQGRDFPAAILQLEEAVKIPNVERVELGKAYDSLGYAYLREALEGRKKPEERLVYVDKAEAANQESVRLFEDHVWAHINRIKVMCVRQADTSAVRAAWATAHARFSKSDRELDKLCAYAAPLQPKAEADERQGQVAGEASGGARGTK